MNIIIVEDNDGHAGLVLRNLKRLGVHNEFLRFENGQQVLNFLYGTDPKQCPENNKSYLLLLDIRMPVVDGIQVLTKIKSDPGLKKIPVIILTTTDDPKEIEKCYELGCNHYITKPVSYNKLAETIRQLGLFLSIVKTPLFINN